MVAECFFIGVYELPGGSCAQWFSGFASTAAVVVALAANFYGVWRQAKTDKSNDCAEIAGISMTVRFVLRECDANADLFYDGCKLVKVYGGEFFVSQPLGAVKANALPLLTMRQADVLIRHGMAEFAEDFDVHIGNLNLINLAIEDYATRRVSFGPYVATHLNSEKISQVDQTTPDFATFKKEMGILSSSAEQFVKRTKSLLTDSIDFADQFNSFCQSISRFEPYCVDTTHKKESLSELTIKKVELGKVP